MTAIPLIALFAFGAYGTGLLLLRPFRNSFRHPIEEITLASAVGLGALGFIVTITATAHIVSTALLVGVTHIFAIAGLAGICLWKRFAVAAEPPPQKEPVAWWEIAVGVLVAACMILAAVKCFVPSVKPDSLTYHLAAPKIFLQAGGTVFMPTVCQANYPLFTEMYYLLGLALQGEILAKLFSWLFAWLLLGATWSLGHRLYGRRAGSAAVLLIIAIPEVSYQASIAYVDVATTAWLALAAYSCVRYAEKNRAGAAVLAGIFTGLAASAKLPALLSFPFVAAALIIPAWRNSDAARGLFHAVLAGVSCLIIAGPWYVKNLVLAGNPVWPFAYGIFGGKFITGNMVATIRHEIAFFGEPKTIAAFLRFPIKILHDFSPLLICGLPALILVREKRRSGIFLIVTAALFAGIFFWITSQVRFMLVVGVLLAASCGPFFMQNDAPERTKRVTLFLAYGLLLLAAAFAVYRVARHPVRRMLVEAKAFGSPEAYIAENVPEYMDYSEMNRTLPENARVLLLAESPYYLDREWLFANPGMQAYIDFENLETQDELLGRLTEAGVTHVYINNNSRHISHRPQTKAARKKFFDLEKKGKLTAVFQRKGATLFEVVQ
ncbi:MAG: ArnT family glycosyltransferase [Planctomycetota bacterium]|jgi:hypothetical protein